MIFSLCWSWFPFFKIFVEGFKVSSKQFCTFKNRQEYVPIYLEIFLNKGLSIRFGVPSIYPIHVIRFFSDQKLYANKGNIHQHRNELGTRLHIRSVANNIHGKLRSFFSRIYYSRAATQK